MDILNNTYVTYDNRLTDYPIITNDIAQSWHAYINNVKPIDFDNFSESFMSLSDLPYMLAIEDFEHAEGIDSMFFDEILIAQWLDQIQKYDNVPPVSDDICLEYSKDIEIWIYRQDENAYGFIVAKDCEKLFDSDLEQYFTFEDALRAAVDELWFVYGNENRGNKMDISSDSGNMFIVPFMEDAGYSFSRFLNEDHTLAIFDNGEHLEIWESVDVLEVYGFFYDGKNWQYIEEY